MILVSEVKEGDKTIVTVEDLSKAEGFTLTTRKAIKGNDYVELEIRYPNRVETIPLQIDADADLKTLAKRMADVKNENVVITDIKTLLGGGGEL